MAGRLAENEWRRKGNVGVAGRAWAEWAEWDGGLTHSAQGP